MKIKSNEVCKIANDIFTGHPIQNTTQYCQPFFFLYIFKDTKNVINKLKLQQMLKMLPTFSEDKQSPFSQCLLHLSKEFVGQHQQ